MGLPERKENWSDRTKSASVEALELLWQIKVNSITLLEQWSRETNDLDIRAGLQSQVLDERRHLRVIGDELRRLGARVNGHENKEALSRPFLELRARRADWQRLFIYYRGIKSFTVDRCSHLIPVVGSQVAQVLERITRDEERHIRWAEVRIERLCDNARTREGQLLVFRLYHALEMTWGRPHRRLRLVD
jgi:hypothetical protein